jgi:hypothetical protein
MLGFGKRFADSAGAASFAAFLQVPFEPEATTRTDGHLCIPLPLEESLFGKSHHGLFDVSWSYVPACARLAVQSHRQGFHSTRAARLGTLAWNKRQLER